MKKYFINWKYLNRIIITINSITIILGGIYTYTQFHIIKNEQLNRENDLSMRYYDRLNFGDNKKIYILIEDQKPVLINAGGEFSEDQLDDYLGELHDVGESLYADLLDNRSTCSRFSDLTERTFENQEVQKYLTKIRKIDP